VRRRRRRGHEFGLHRLRASRREQKWLSPKDQQNGTREEITTHHTMDRKKTG
jgi:hypothetical protein